jgi:hypothetical protein
MLSNDRMIEWWTGKGLEGTGRGLIRIISWKLPGGTEENHKRLASEYLIFRPRDSNRTPSEYESTVLPLRQSVLFQLLSSYSSLLSCGPVARQQIPNTHQCTKLAEVFPTRSVRQLRDATIEELLREVFSVKSVPRCYKQDKSRIWLVVRQSPSGKDVKWSWGIYGIGNRYQAMTGEDTTDWEDLVLVVLIFEVGGKNIYFSTYPPPRSPTECVRSNKPKWNGVSWRKAKAQIGAVVPRGKKYADASFKPWFYLLLDPIWYI